MNNPHLAQLSEAQARFKAVIQALPEARFLEKMSGWSLRDVSAHLIGWNRYILDGCRAISAGLAPSYHADAPNDYRHINAEFVSLYAATDRQALMEELDATLKTLLEYLRGLAAADWEADHGIEYYRGGRATIASSVESLARDYHEHAEEIEAWAKAGEV
ncbi:MAG TPA: DinB family protein [Anaerolineales bacterium]|nr:DinB family protein [Anaerolineales bacterium]